MNVIYTLVEWFLYILLLLSALSSGGALTCPGGFFWWHPSSVRPGTHPCSVQPAGRWCPGRHAAARRRWAGAQPWSGPLGVTVGLQKIVGIRQKCVKYNFFLDWWNLVKTYVAAKGEEGGGDVGDVFLLIQIDSLEDIEVRAAVVSEGLLEPAKSPKNYEHFFLDHIQFYCDYNWFKWKGAAKLANLILVLSGYKYRNRHAKVRPPPKIAHKNRK
jgi:hypothetical protein